MKKIVPSDREAWNELRNCGCTWIGGHGCECYSRQLGMCFEDCKKRMTKTEYTEEEIAESAKRNEAMWDEIMAMI